jgi:acetyltransferase
VIQGPNSYPTHLIGAVRLAGAGPAIIRPALPQDGDLQRDFFRTLSAEDRYLRFMARLPGLTDEMAQRFANVDHRRHLALLACVSVGGRETMIGEARCIIDGKEPSTGEFAVAVAGGWQGLGLGRILLARLITHAAASGISRLVADTLACNAGMIALAERCGFAVDPKREDRRLLRLVKDLRAANAHAATGALPSWGYGMPLKAKANRNFHEEERR